MNFQTDNLPLVSIVAINYNNSKYVIETLNSIAEQTYPNVELIIVDDCSTDDSVQKIEDWLLNYPKKNQFIRGEVNKGVCATCNKGYKAAKGKYISSIATDDVMLPEKIAKQVSFFESLPADVGMIFSDAYVIDENSEMLFGTFIQKHRNFDKVPSGYIFEDILEKNYIPAMTAMTKSSIFETLGFFDENLVYEDFDMWLRIAKNYKIIFQDEITVKYRKRSGNLTSAIESQDWLYSNFKIFVKHTDSELAKRKMETIISDLYFRNFPCKNFLQEYEEINNVFIRRCIKLGISPHTATVILTFIRLYRVILSKAKIK